MNPSSNDPRKILIIEDSKTVRNLLTHTLQNEGYDVYSTERGKSGLKKAFSLLPSLIILDLKLPDIHGLDFLKALKYKSKTSDIPIVILTNHASKKTVEEALDLGADDVISKDGFEVTSFLHRFKKALSDASDQTTDENTSIPEEKSDQTDTQKQQTSSDSGSKTSSKHSGKKPRIDDDEMFITEDEVSRKIKRFHEMKALPPIVTRVRKLANSSRTSVGEMVDVLQKDQAIAARVMKLAKSVFYAVQGEVTSLHKAVVNIGMREVANCVLSIAVHELFGDQENSEDGTLDIIQLWQHSFCAGSYCRRLSENVQGINKEQIFLTGLLHNIGINVYFDCFPDRYEKLLRRAIKTGIPLQKFEERLLPSNHYELGKKCLRTWKLADEIIQPIPHCGKSWNELGQMKPENRKSVLVLKVSKLLANARGIEDPGEGTFGSFPGQYNNEFYINTRELLKVNEEITKEVKNLQLIFYEHDSDKAQQYFGQRHPSELQDSEIHYFPSSAQIDPVSMTLETMDAEIKRHRSAKFVTDLPGDGTILYISKKSDFRSIVELLEHEVQLENHLYYPVVLLFDEDQEPLVEHLPELPENTTTFVSPFTAHEIWNALTV